MAKTIKVLSDGTVAKVGMIVIHSCAGDYTLTKIVRLNGRNGHIEIDMESYTKGLKWCTSEKYLRKATPEERKQYYQRLYASNNK